MVRRKNEYRFEAIQHMKGGSGEFKVTHILNSSEFYGKGKQFAIGTLEPGHSVGMHTHSGDMEVCFFIRGRGIVREESAEHEIESGDTNIVLDGMSHEIENTGSELLEYISLILFS